jgi:hypothetical protein
LKKLLKALNLGCSIGSNQLLTNELVEWTGIDLDVKVLQEYVRLNKCEYVRTDAFDYLYRNFWKYQIIWVGLDCQEYTNYYNTGPGSTSLPYLISWLFLNCWDRIWVVENVVPKKKFFAPVDPVKIGRHLFWSNKPLFSFSTPKFSGPNFMKKTPEQTTKEYVRLLEDYLGFRTSKYIYVRGNNDSGQVLRNCTHPIIGLVVLLLLLMSK